MSLDTSLQGTSQTQKTEAQSDSVEGATPTGPSLPDPMAGSLWVKTNYRK